MENEMVERVARAQFARAYRVAPDEPGFEGLPDGPERDEWLAAARVAIEAMFTPTSAMIRAGGAPAQTTWHLMITAALTPTQETKA